VQRIELGDSSVSAFQQSLGLLGWLPLEQQKLVFAAAS
jgi:hypothetical protein